MSKQDFKEIELSKFKPNPWNRKHVDDLAFRGLVESVKTKGVIVPILARPLKGKKNEKTPYEIIYGERRWRAACEVAGKNLNGHKISTIIQEMSDDEAFDATTIENLQRKNLTELEEAQYFKAYIDRHGEGAIEDLGSRCSLNPAYIRRRIRVLELPEYVTKAWEKGQIKYGHCEQLARLLPEEKAVKEFWNICKPDRDGDVTSISELKRRINLRSVKLGSAKFDTEEVGCTSCINNSEVQAVMFEDVSGLEKKSCIDPVCFKKNQAAFFKAEWPIYAKQFGTKGFVFEEDANLNHYDSKVHCFDAKHSYYTSYNPGDKCFECKDFISVIDLTGKFIVKQACRGKQKCYETEKKSLKEKKDKKKDKGKLTEKQKAELEKKKAEENEKRSIQHGEYFREEFYKGRIPELMKSFEPDGQTILRCVLAAIFHASHSAKQAFAASEKIKGHYGNTGNKEVWPVIAEMDSRRIFEALRAAAMLIILKDEYQNNFGAIPRHLVAVHLGSDLQRDWRIDAAYLEKKTTAEIIDMGEKLGIFADQKAQDYLFVNLGKKRGKFSTCKKGELVKIILESGVDLAGKVPDEILNVPGLPAPIDPNAPVELNKYGCEVVIEDDDYCPRFDDDEIYDTCQAKDTEFVFCCRICPANRDCKVRCGKVAVCRVCGCTDTCGCPEGCSWAEPDLCSVCAEKEVQNGSTESAG